MPRTLCRDRISVYKTWSRDFLLVRHWRPVVLALASAKPKCERNMGMAHAPFSSSYRENEWMRDFMHFSLWCPPVSMARRITGCSLTASKVSPEQNWHPSNSLRACECITLIRPIVTCTGQFPDVYFDLAYMHITVVTAVLLRRWDNKHRVVWYIIIMPSRWCVPLIIQNSNGAGY